jgi:hypothetical protein
MVVRGRFNSSITRVRPVFQALLERDPSGQSWLPNVLRMATHNAAYAKTVQSNIGKLHPDCTVLRPYNDRILKFYGIKRIELAKCFERSMPPPPAFLSWLITHPEQMNWPRTKKGHKRFGHSAQDQRKKLFGEHGQEAQQAAQEDALSELRVVGADGSSRKWWAFEGFSDVDCCLETDHLLLLIEGKRTEPLGPSTDWYPKRNQLIRNLEVAESLASGRQFGVVVIAESDIGNLSKKTIDASLPHFHTAERENLMRHYFGCLSWTSVCTELNIPCEVLWHETHEVVASLKATL